MRARKIPQNTYLLVLDSGLHVYQPCDRVDHKKLTDLPYGRRSLEPEGDRQTTLGYAYTHA
jgi:hypothetical protein